MKKLSILALCATAAIAPAFAETGVNYTTPSVELSNQQADLSFAFDDVENLQAIAMTDKEMMEMEGAALPYIAEQWQLVASIILAVMLTMYQKIKELGVDMPQLLVVELLAEQ